MKMCRGESLCLRSLSQNTRTVRLETEVLQLIVYFALWLCLFSHFFMRGEMQAIWHLLSTISTLLSKYLTGLERALDTVLCLVNCDAGSQFLRSWQKLTLKGTFIIRSSSSLQASLNMSLSALVWLPLCFSQLLKLTQDLVKTTENNARAY